MRIKHLILIILLIQGCTMDYSPDKRDIKLFNDSKNDIYCFMSQSDVFTAPFPGYPKGLDRKEADLVKKNMSINFSSLLKWESYLEKCEGGKVRFFVVLKDTVDKYGWEDVFKTNKYSKIYKLSLTDINNRNWTLTYCGQCN